MNRKRYILIVGIVVAAALFSILFHGMLANNQPVIASLEADSEIVLPQGSCQITCNATDPDGDGLSYEWWTNAGEITGEGATVTWTAPRFAGSYNITVTVTDGRGGEVTDYVTISPRANTAPTISSVTADADWTAPSGSLRVTCDASDRDGDDLTYDWAATGGDISGTGAAVDWIAPQTVGTYNLTVVVRDGRGGGDMREVLLSVSPGTPPTIEDLIANAEELKYLKESSIPGCDYDVWKTKEYYIECIVTDASGELVYDWSCDGGEISGEGSTITWIAPNQSSVDVTVTVIVSDAAGNKVGKNLVLHVPSCACGF
jgi:hypothetical protein